MSNIQEALSAGLHKLAFGLRKVGPEIGTVAGMAGIAASAIYLYKAVNESKDILAKVKEEVKKLEDEGADEKDIKAVKIAGGVAVAKKVAIPAGLAVASSATVLGIHHEMRKENRRLSEVITQTSLAYNALKNELREQLGDEQADELIYGVRKPDKKEIKEIEENSPRKDEITDEERKSYRISDGEEITPSPYAVFFDETCNNYTDDPEYNKNTLILLQAQLNERLKRIGYVYLNEVYEKLGVEKTEAGHVMGWRYAPHDPNHEGDNQIDFNMWDIRSRANRRFINGYEPVVLLDFNIDPEPIMHQVYRRKR